MKYSLYLSWVITKSDDPRFRIFGGVTLAEAESRETAEDMCAYLSHLQNVQLTPDPGPRYILFVDLGENFWNEAVIQGVAVPHNRYENYVCIDLGHALEMPLWKLQRYTWSIFLEGVYIKPIY